MIGVSRCNGCPSARFNPLVKKATDGRHFRLDQGIQVSIKASRLPRL
jgi:hypothetical protein